MPTRPISNIRISQQGFAEKLSNGIIISQNFLEKLPFHIHNGLFKSAKQKQVVRPVVSQSVAQGSYE